MSRGAIPTEFEKWLDTLTEYNFNSDPQELAIIKGPIRGYSWVVCRIDQANSDVRVVYGGSAGSGVWYFNSKGILSLSQPGIITYDEVLNWLGVTSWSGGGIRISALDTATVNYKVSQPVNPPTP